HEWRQTLPESSSLYAEAACSIPIGNADVGTLEALQPWADVIAQLGMQESGEKKKIDFKKLMHEAAPAWAWAIPFVGEIAHAALETSRLIKDQRMHGTASPNAANQQQIFQQYVNLLTKIAEDTPLVILLDDMHWADASSTNLLFYLSRQITTKKILVISTYRPDDAIAANGGEGHPIIKVKNEILRYSAGRELFLKPLENAAIRELLQATFPAYKINTELEHWLQKISDGNSLFITQFLKTLIEDGRIDENGIFSGSYDDVPIPQSALAVVEERTRRLDEGTRELLQYATAEGEEFTSYVLGQLTNKKPLELLKDLRKAEGAGLVRSKGTTRTYANQTTSIFGFSHALFHKALYDSLLEEERAILHRECYTILKTEWDKIQQQQDKTLALASKLLTHAEKCGELETAADVALAAAGTAWGSFAETEALAMLGNVERFMNTEPPPVMGDKRYELLGNASLMESRIDVTRGRYNDSLQAAIKALEHFRKSRDAARTIDAWLQKAWALFLKGEYKEAESETQSALAQKEIDDKQRAFALNVIGLVRGYTGSSEEALSFHMQSLALREKIGDNSNIASSLGNIGNVKMDMGAYDEAIDYYKKSIALSESFDDRYHVALTLNNIGDAYNALGKYDDALAHLKRSIGIAESIGDMAGVARSLSNIGNIRFNLGEYEESLVSHTKSKSICDSIGDRVGVARSLNNTGRVYSVLDQEEKALACYTECLAIREAMGDRQGKAVALTNIGSTYNDLGMPEKALEAQKESLRLAEEVGDRMVQTYALTGIGYVYMRAKKINDALVFFQHALDVAEAIKRPLEQAAALNGLGEAHRVTGKYAESRSALERSLNLSRECKEKGLEAVALCQIGLLEEAQSAGKPGEEQKAMLRSASEHLGQGVTILTELKSGNSKKFAEDLQRIRAVLG
ncbi:MAG TPA: tetratricopeptide repeat protein, partial [Candidatus Kapabacteria bacterium]|nr:tetratricopeptide repeat protein [Candidatus Kapabacteria bacterium]